MNKIIKVIVAILGGVNTTFSLIIPIFVSFLILNMYSNMLGPVNQTIILFAGFLSSFYRALSLWIQ